MRPASGSHRLFFIFPDQGTLTEVTYLTPKGHETVFIEGLILFLISPIHFFCRDEHYNLKLVFLHDCHIPTQLLC